MIEPDHGPVDPRWSERPIDPLIASALGLTADSDDDAIAGRMRALIGLPPARSSDPRLWRRFVYGIELACTAPQGPVGDQALLANTVVEWAIAEEDSRFGLQAWDHELDVERFESDERLREFVFEVVASRLARAGLYRLH